MAPAAYPASITVDVVPAATFHVTATEVPVTTVVNVEGGSGGVQPTFTTRSLVGALVPTAFRARTRTKYWPVGTPPTARLVPVVGAEPRLADPCELPASTR